MSTKHACGPNCGDEPDVPMSLSKGHLTAEDREALADLALLYGTFIIGRWAELMVLDTEPPDDWEEQAAREAVDLFAPAAADLIATHRAEAIAQHARSHGCDETPALRERLAVEFLALEALGRVARAIDEEIARLGQTEPGDPIRAGLIEGYRYASRIIREQIRGDA